MESILEEAWQLASNGVKELIIIAQDTTRYGIDLYGEHKLDVLLEELCKIEGVRWIRLHYCYPEDITEGLIQTIARQAKICHYLDIPIQHCNNQILKRMGRRGTKEELVHLIGKIRSSIPDIILRTSIIVGFPGENEEQFEELREFVSKIRFDRMGVFMYSQEEDTLAALFEDQIEDRIKQERYQELMEIQVKISRENSHKKIGKQLEVLVEGYDTQSGYYYGRSYGDSIDIDGKVFFKNEHEISAGNFVKVKIIDAVDYDLIGENLHESCE